MMSSVIQFSESRSGVTCRNCNLGELLIVLPSACWCTRASPSLKKLGQTIGGVESVMYVASVGSPTRVEYGDTKIVHNSSSQQTATSESL